MAKNEKLFYDSTTETYFYSSYNTILGFVKDILDETCFNDPSCTYVDLIRDFQSRLGIPEISEDSRLYTTYEARNGRMLKLDYRLMTLPAGTEVVVVTYE